MDMLRGWRVYIRDYWRGDDMRDEERLGEIKVLQKQANHAENNFDGNTVVKTLIELQSKFHLDWLIEQAERAQELELKNKMYDEAVEEDQNVKDRLADELKILTEQNKRYELALEYIASIEFYEGTQELYADMSEASEIAENALRGDTNE